MHISYNSSIYNHTFTINLDPKLTASSLFSRLPLLILLDLNRVHTVGDRR